MDLARGYGGVGAVWTRTARQASGLPLTFTAGMEANRMDEHRRGFVNNAGILGRAFGIDDLTVGAMQEVFDTNVLGIVRVTNAALPLLRRSANPVIVNVASGVGFARALSTPGTDEHAVRGLPYAASKAAVIAMTVQYAKNLPEFRVNASDPG